MPRSMPRNTSPPRLWISKKKNNKNRILYPFKPKKGKSKLWFSILL